MSTAETTKLKKNRLKEALYNYLFLNEPYNNSQIKFPFFSEFVAVVCLCANIQGSVKIAKPRKPVIYLKDNKRSSDNALVIAS